MVPPIPVTIDLDTMDAPEEVAGCTLFPFSEGNFCPRVVFMKRILKTEL